MNVITQHYVPDNISGQGLIGIHRVELTGSSAETLTVPFLTTTNGVTQLRVYGDASATVSASDNTTVSITGSKGQKVTILTHHPRSSHGTQVTPGTPTVDG